MNKYCEVILNPASGQKLPQLKYFNRAFKRYGYDWGIKITNRTGDAQLFAQEASKYADIVAVYGGDGTVNDVISGMVGSDVPLGILPGGTGNVLAIELGIPWKTLDALDVILAEKKNTRAIDVGITNDKKYFMLQASFGLPADMIEMATRKEKDRFGHLAYIISGIRALKQQKYTTYSFTVDGKYYECEGISFIVSNTGSIGIPHFSLDDTATLFDGMFDIYILKSGKVKSLASLLYAFLSGKDVSSQLFHVQGKSVEIHSGITQNAQLDGELWQIESSPLRMELVHKAVSIIVP